MSSYDFQTQFDKGQRYEHELDSYFAAWYFIQPASRDEQRQGIDRKFVHSETGRAFSVEYKADETAARTHNAFIEIMSVDVKRKLGWAYSSRADYLFYFVPGDGSAIYIIPFRKLRKKLGDWVKLYPRMSIPNVGYQTIGLLVPLRELEMIAQKVA